MAYPNEPFFHRYDRYPAPPRRRRRPPPSWTAVPDYLIDREDFDDVWPEDSEYWAPPLRTARRHLPRHSELASFRPYNITQHLSEKCPKPCAPGAAVSLETVASVGICDSSPSDSSCSAVSAQKKTAARSGRCSWRKRRDRRRGSDSFVEESSSPEPRRHRLSAGRESLERIEALAARVEALAASQESFKMIDQLLAHRGGEQSCERGIRSSCCCGCGRGAGSTAHLVPPHDLSPRLDPVCHGVAAAAAPVHCCDYSTTCTDSCHLPAERSSVARQSRADLAPECGGWDGAARKLAEDRQRVALQELVRQAIIQQQSGGGCSSGSAGGRQAAELAEPSRWFIDSLIPVQTGFEPVLLSASSRTTTTTIQELPTTAGAAEVVASPAEPRSGANSPKGSSFGVRKEKAEALRAKLAEIERGIRDIHQRVKVNNGGQPTKRQADLREVSSLTARRRAVLAALREIDKRSALSSRLDI